MQWTLPQTPVVHPEQELHSQMKGPTNSHKPLSPKQNSGVALSISVAIAGMVHVHIIDARFGPHRIGLLRHAV
jgi:hypothetical protein